jgi:hypothetical protein
VGILLRFDPLYTAAVLFPAALGAAVELLPPWMLLAPDYGYALVTPRLEKGWSANIKGRRGGPLANAPQCGVPPALRGEEWVRAAKVGDYERGELNICFIYNGLLGSGEKISLTLTVPELKRPEGIEDAVWKRIRRPYMNVWQPASDWMGKPAAAMVLANNVLSDPASLSLWYYSAPMHFWHEPLQGIDVSILLRHSLDFYIRHYCSPVGHMVAFGMHDLYVSCNANFLIAAWDYFKISGDLAWFRANIMKLNNLADYLIRRDIDDDGIIESYGSGNRGMLRNPDRADVWWEMVNFNYKNSWLNIVSYRAFLCFSEILKACGYDKGAARFEKAAGRIKERFYELFYNPQTGVIASWISLDGEMHDYAYTPINGMAVAYGLVPRDKAKGVMRRMLDLLAKSGFDAIHLGVPLNLLPIHPLDRIQPSIGPDGELDEQWIQHGGEDGSADFGKQVYNGSISPVQTWHFILGLQKAGFADEADAIINAMSGTAYCGGFHNGIVNCGYGGAEHLRWDGNTCGYEGYLADEWVFLTTAFTGNEESLKSFLGPVYVGSAE